MSTVNATLKETRAGRTRLLALASAVALVALASGHVAAVPLRDDGGREDPLWIGVSPHVVAKLGTTAGYEVLVFG